MKSKLLILFLFISYVVNAQNSVEWIKIKNDHYTDTLSVLKMHNSTKEPTYELDSMLVRISEIDVHPKYLDEYIKAALTVGADSVANEPGVVCIYPMVQKRDESKVRILEIYQDMDAYRHHISTPWFQTYKQGTLHMVKNLDLVDMRPMNPSAMVSIFRKM